MRGLGRAFGALPRRRYGGRECSWVTMNSHEFPVFSHESRYIKVMEKKRKARSGRGWRMEDGGWRIEDGKAEIGKAEPAETFNAQHSTMNIEGKVGSGMRNAETFDEQDARRTRTLEACATSQLQETFNYEYRNGGPDFGALPRRRYRGGRSGRWRMEKRKRKAETAETSRRR